MLPYLLGPNQITVYKWNNNGRLWIRYLHIGVYKKENKQEIIHLENTGIEANCNV